MRPEGLVGHGVGLGGRADDPVFLGHEIGHGEPEEARQKLSFGQVPRGTEQDDDVIVGPGLGEPWVFLYPPCRVGSLMPSCISPVRLWGR